MLVKDRINVFSQTKNKRVLVGHLWKNKDKYFFKYDKTYQKMSSALPLGPEFTLWKSEFSAKVFFPSLADRIPSKKNPAYVDYCRQWGIDEHEKDQFILLTTIGRRGPSTFIFEPAVENLYNGNDLRAFRKKLALTQPEFEKLVGVSHATMVKLENSKSENEFYLRYFNLLEQVPAALKWLIKERGYYLHDEKRARLLKQFT